MTMVTLSKEECLHSSHHKQTYDMEYIHGHFIPVFASVDVANAERDGAIGKASADRDKDIQVAENMAEAEKGKKAAQADQRIFVQEQEATAVQGENISRAQIAEYNASLAEKEAEAMQRAEVARRQAEAEVERAQYDVEEARLKAEEIAKEEIAKHIKDHLKTLAGILWRMPPVRSSSSRPL